MALQTVSVPLQFEPLFAAAEQVVSRYFSERVADPTRGTIEICGERYVLVRAASLSVEFFVLVESLFGLGREAEAARFASNILFDLAHAIGSSDAKNFHARMGLEDPIARLSAGPVHFAHAGWAFVQISAESSPTPDEEFVLYYDHPYSFEADAWVRAERHATSPVCIMNAGYSSGWCEESFGVELVATEISCRACGASACSFVMAHPRRIEDRIRGHLADRTPHPDKGAWEIPDLFVRKRMEDELRRAHVELEQKVLERTEELRTSERKLMEAQKLEAVGRLTGGIAHDFNNILGVIIGNADFLIRALGADSVQRPLVDEIMAASRKAADLTRRLLTFSRAQPIERVPTELGDLVHELLPLLSRAIGEEICLTMDLQTRGAVVNGDRGQLEQVIMNLVMNARDAMPQGGELDIGVAPAELESELMTPLGVLRPGFYARMAVRDTGSGLDAETLSRAFDPFFSTKSSQTSSGLGLSIVAGVVRQHGGGVAVRSEVGIGSEFVVFLPLHEGEAWMSQRETTVDEATLRGTETVLVVEDQAPVRSVIVRALREVGYNVLEAVDGDDAIRVAAAMEDPLDVLVTDVILPGRRGPDLADILCATRPALRVLFVSGYMDPMSFAQLGEVRSRPLLSKPFTPAELRRRVRDLLDGRS